MSIKQKLMNALKFIGAAAAFAIIVPFVGAKASAETVGAFEVTGGTQGTDYTYANGVLTIKTDTAITIANADKTKSTTDTIVVEKDKNAKITLAGVNIDVSAQDDAAFKIADDSMGNVTITLAGGSTNVLKSGEHCAGLQKGGIFGSLEIKGTGTLEAKGGDYAAGIGGFNGKNGVEITISGGTVTATGGNYAAGIGGGLDSKGSDITISGGTVTATGGDGGAGIGGGEGGDGSSITITGGTVTAKGSNSSAGTGGGAGIGGGAGGNGSFITINGGTVTATGGNYAAGIGSGKRNDLDGNADLIKINGGSVVATGIYAFGSWGRGAVTPKNSGGKEVYLLELDQASNSLTIDGKDYPIHHTDNKVYVYLTEGEHTIETDSVKKTVMLAKNSSGKLVEIGTAFKITATNGDTLDYGTDYTYTGGVLTIKSAKAITIANADPNTPTTDTIVVEKNISAKITLDGVNIDASEKIEIAAFKIEDNSTGNVTITLADNSYNKLKGGKNCAGLQKNGSGNNIGTLTIQGDTNGTGSLEATSGLGVAAGIGGGKFGIDKFGSGSNIKISGGIVKATGYTGIGGGGGEGGEYITITGGTVIATGKGGAGIGGGSEGTGSYITISGGTVTATGVDSGAGIGGGIVGNGSYITISGGTVTATGGAGGAGIGGGELGSASDIKIIGGSVKAIGGKNANAIGGGKGKGVVTPTNGSDAVYLCEIENPNGDPITIDGTAYTPVNHKAADPNDKTLYAYLTGIDHTVTVGSTKYNCTFDSTNSSFTLTQVINPSPNPNPNPSTRPTKPETPDYPEFNGKAMSWEDIADEIAKLDEGSEITLVIYDHTEVPVDVINAISDRKIKATLKVGGRKDWVVDGAKITEKVLKNVDFSLGSADVSGKEKLRGIVGFEFSFDGAEFTSELSLMFKEEHAGKFANLFRKDGEKLVFIDNAKISSDGSVSGLTVREKGEYAVMICEFSDRAGDVDNDGILTAKDALAALKHFAKVENGANPAVADMNNDGVVNANDALIILKKYAGIAG